METMEKSIIVFTIFIYLFFTFSTVAIALNKISLPTKHEQQPKTTTTATTESVPFESPYSETTQVFNLKTMDPQRMIINRHFYENTRIPLRFVRKHPCNKNKFKKMMFMIHDHDDHLNYNKNKRVVSYANDMVLTDLTTRFDDEKYPTKRFEFKHRYGHGHHHHHEKEEMEKKERKGGFMTGIRKFLKHTFD